MKKTSNKPKIIDNMAELKTAKILVDLVEHEEYFYYTEHVNSVESPFSLYFGFISNNPEENKDANDPKEWDLQEPGYLCFCRCLSYFKNESVAMRNMYADKNDSSDKAKIKNNRGICYRFTKKLITAFQERVSEINIIFEDKSEESKKTKTLPLNANLKKLLSDSKIIFKLRHVLYYENKHNKKIGINYVEILRSTHKRMIAEDLYEKLRKENPMKKMCWSYETEAKLYCYLSNSIFDYFFKDLSDHYKTKGILIKLRKPKKNMMQIRSHPEEDRQEDKSFLNGANVTLESSKLKGCVRFTKNQKENQNETVKNQNTN